MRLCPKCGSKELVPVVFGEKTDHSKIIQKKIDAGEYLYVNKARDGYPYLACKSCGFKWPLGGLPIRYLKKVRFKMDEFGVNGLKSGNRVIEIFPDGRVRYYAHKGSDTRASKTAGGKVSEKSVQELFEKLDEIKTIVYSSSQDVSLDRAVKLQMLYTDNDKIIIAGDLPDGTIRESIMAFVGAVPEIKKELETAFEDAETGVYVPDSSAAGRPGDEMESLRARLDEIRRLILDKRPEEAKPLMDALAKEADDNPMFREDEVSQYFLFREWFEECVYRHMYEPDKELRPARYPYDEIYALQGSLYIELHNLEKARECLKKALVWNPVNASVSFERNSRRILVTSVMS